MKKFKIYFLLPLIFLFLGACSENDIENSEDQSNSNTTESPSIQDPVQAIDNMQEQTADSVIDLGEAPKGEGLNPAHGQPGHRCEIPVGAPLNSEPTNTMNQSQIVTEPQPNTQPNFNPPAGNETAGKKLNPPHGEPGHDCAVAVGAPLN